MNRPPASSTTIFSGATSRGLTIGGEVERQDAWLHRQDGGYGEALFVFP